MTFDDVFIVFVHDSSDVPKIWVKRWELSYPLANSIEVSGGEGRDEWIGKIQKEVDLVHDAKIMFVGHGAGSNALVAWFYTQGIDSRRDFKGAMLVSPAKKHWPDDPSDPLNRSWVDFPTALVTAKNDPESPVEWARTIARNMNAKYIQSPFEHGLNDALKGWQWGMKLMQEIMLL